METLCTAEKASTQSGGKDLHREAVPTPVLPFVQLQFLCPAPLQEMNDHWLWGKAYPCLEELVGKLTFIFLKTFFEYLHFIYKFKQK